jgi:hypothetical protein
MAYFVEEKRRGKGFKMGSIEGGGFRGRALVGRRRCFVHLAFERRYVSTFSQTAFFFSWFDMFCGEAYGLCILEILTCLTLIIHCRSEVREHPAPCKKTWVAHISHALEVIAHQ